MENNANENNTVNRNKKEDSIDLRYIVDVIWDLKYWIIAAVAAALVFGFIYIRLSTPQYQRTATVLIANDRLSGGMGSEMQLLSDITGMKANGIVQNELYIIRSRPLMQKVVEDLNLNVRYFKKSHVFLTQEMYGNSPISFELVSGSHKNRYPSISVEIQVNEDTTSYVIKELTFVSNSADAKHPKRKEFKDRQYNFGDAVNLPDNNVIIISKSAASASLEPERYTVTHISPKKYAKAYCAKLNAGTTDYKERSSVISLSLTDNIPSRADDILNTLIEKYNTESKDFMNISTMNTLEFIDARLTELEKQLGDIETEARNYKTENSLVDFMFQSQASITKGTQYETQLTEIGIQLKFMEMIKKYMAEPGNEYSLLPADIGISDSGLSSSISEYNKVVMERRRLLLNASETNPRVVLMTSQIEDMRKAIALSVDQLAEAYQLQYDTILSEAQAEQSKISDIPAKQIDVAKIERQQSIVEPLYILLRQKKEEALIALSAVTDNARIVEPADGPDTPSSPKPMMIYFMCLVLGFIAPPGVFFLKDLLKRKVSTVKDITDRTEVPVLGVIASTKDEAFVVQGSRDIFSETFRAVRANMGFLKGKVFQITSSISGEGKSTVAINIALTLAFAGNKVLLLETDLRNGFDYKFFNVPKSPRGLSTLLSGKSTLEEVLHKGLRHQNLDVILRGSIPPNPSELLTSKNMEELVASMREKYDYVICDSSPYIVISDPLVVNKFVDGTIYVVRCGYSDLRFIDEIDMAATTNRLRNISIVVNSADMAGKTYGRGGSYGYGYGYGYTTGSSKKQ